MLNNKKLLSNTILYSIGEIVPKILSFILLPILTVYLTTEEYGINSYTTSVMMFVFVLASLSFNTYLLSQFYKEKDINKRKVIVGTVFYSIMIFNIILLVLQLLIFPGIISFFDINIPFYPFFFLAILNNFFDVMAIIPLALYRVNDDVKGFLIVSLSRTILQYILILIFVVHLKYGLEGSLYGRLIANIPYIFVYLYYINKQGKFIIVKSIFKSALRFSLPLLPGSISYMLISLSDRVILERYTSLEKIGIFSVASTLALALNIVIQALYKTIEPVLFKEHVGNNFSAVNAMLYKTYLCVIFVGAFGVAIFSKEIFVIAASHNFLIGYKIVPGLVVSVVIAGINIYLAMLLITESKQNYVSLITIVSGIVCIVLNLILIPFMGYYGAVITSIVSFLIVNIFCHYKIYIEKRYVLSQVILMILIVLIPYLYDSFIVIDNIPLTFLLKFVLFVLFSLLVIKVLHINFNKIKNILIKPTNDVKL
jgi:O-antigen/teichoic acid export membrane protein